MKISKNSGTESYGERYMIYHDEGVQTGIFFRSPFRKITYKVYPDKAGEYSLIHYVHDIRANKRFRLFSRLLGNNKIINEIYEDDLDIFTDDLYGIDINTIICPIYFKRNYRYLDIINLEEKGPIDYITSFGYDDEYIDVAGECNKEITKIKHRYKRNEYRIRFGKNYLYTYTHSAKELIKTLECKDIAEGKRK